jgi:hypothetical protein
MTTEVIKKLRGYNLGNCHWGPYYHYDNKRGWYINDTYKNVGFGNLIFTI